MDRSRTSFINFFMSAIVWEGFSVLSSARNALTASVSPFLKMCKQNTKKVVKSHLFFHSISVTLAGTCRALALRSLFSATRRPFASSWLRRVSKLNCSQNPRTYYFSQPCCQNTSLFFWIILQNKLFVHLGNVRVVRLHQIFHSKIRPTDVATTFFFKCSGR